nr:rRNA pseudouridine synthase [Oscillospiraceae bacterium]
MRIDKLLSELGLCTRREAAKIAKSGSIMVDGTVVKDVSKHIDPEKNCVTFLGREVVYQKYTYVMLNKPEGYVSATDDKSLPYVTELLPEELRRRELFPVGRLDRDTVGLMILTNNGPLAHSLLSPKHHVKKEYYFTSAEPLDSGAEEAFKVGITLADGYECKPAELYLEDNRREGRIVLTEGKYHQIKRMIASRDNRVTSLERISFGGISLDPSLLRGEWRYLTDEEIALLEKQVN